MQKQQLEQSKDERATTRGNVVGPKPTSYKPHDIFFWEKGKGGGVGNHADMVYVNL